MTIEISIHGKEGDVKTKSFKIPTDKIIKGITYLGVFNFFGREAMRIRPPRRNAGVILNYMTAAVITDAVMHFAFPKKKDSRSSEDDPIDVECESFEEVMKDLEEYE